jgi:hypothetical protein
MNKHLRLFICFAVIIIGFKAQAASMASPLGFSLVNPAEVPGDDYSIKGLRLSLIYGNHRNVSGIDLGLIGNFTEQDFKGTAISGIFNHTAGDTTIVGAQIAGIVNINKARASIYGVQFAIGANLGEYTDIYGVQIGLYNRAREVYGLQIGLLNYATNLHGVQIGLLNFNSQGWFSMSPLINIGF